MCHLQLTTENISTHYTRRRLKVFGIPATHTEARVKTRNIELSESSPGRRSAIPYPRPRPPRMFWPFQVSPAGPRVVRLLRGDIASHQAEAIAVSANPHLKGTLRSNYWRFSGRSNADGAVRLAGGRSLAAATAKVSARPPNLGTVELPMR